jgi:hypothetical protein
LSNALTVLFYKTIGSDCSTGSEKLNDGILLGAHFPCVVIQNSLDGPDLLLGNHFSNSWF